MKKYLICIVAIAFGAVGCNRFDDEVVNNLPLATYHATIGEDVSRVHLNGGKLCWNSNDAITLFSTTKAVKYTFTGKDGDTSGEFQPEQGATAGTTPLSSTYALYPHNEANAITSDGVISTSLSATQLYAVNSMGLGANYMVATTQNSTDTSLSFRNLCGYLRLQFYGNNTTVKSIAISGNNGEVLCGGATVVSSYSAEPQITMAADGGKSVVVDCGAGVALGSAAATATEFIVVLPPILFEKGITATITDVDGRVAQQTTANKVEIKRNVINTMVAVEVVPVEATIGGLTVPKSIELPAQSTQAQTISVGSTSEGVTIEASEPWFGVVEQSVASGQTKSIKIWSEPNFSATERNAVLTITGATSGVSVAIPVSQPAYFTTITESFPARLETQSSSYNSSKWVSNGVVSPNNSSAVLCAVAPSGNTLEYTLSSGPIVANLAKGDYLLYAIPTTGVAAGEQIDFMCTLAATAATSPKYFIFEYWDDGEWKSVESALRTAEEDASIKYSLFCKLYDNAYNTTFTQSFTLTKPVENGCVKVRLRSLSDGVGGIRVPSGSGYMGMYMIKYPNAAAVTDTKKILFIGNSFTYYYGTSFMFKEIARTEGHQVNAVIGVKGGQSFEEHLALDMSIDAIKQGGYDYAFLQDTSPNPAIYADKGTQAILDASNQINALTLTYSPSCQIIYERTWACPYGNYRGYGNYDKLDYLLKTGIELLQQKVDCDVMVSPVGLGFRVARGENINLLYTDDRHQSRSGAYMKACINYLTLYKSRFTSAVSDCGVEATLAKRIREIAELVVFEGVEEVYNFDEVTKVQAANCYIIDKAGDYSIRADVMGNGNIPTGSRITSATLNGKGAKVLWSSYNTTTAPASDSELISNVTLEDGMITFTAGENGFKEGNAVIALYDDEACSGKILWSWHIWLCDDIKEQTYNDQVWLDRNLGALAAEAGNPLNIGFYYQFGRKDPFRGAAAINANTYIATTGSWPAVTDAIPAEPEAYAIANPMLLIARNKDPRDWFATSTSAQNHALWNSSGKTMYDPCPLGYHVPDSYAWNVGQAAGTSYFTSSNFIYNDSTYCYTYTSGDTVVVYPIAGCTSGAGALANVGVKGYYRATGNFETTKYGDVLELTPTVINPVQGNYRGSGYSVRCVKE